MTFDKFVKIVKKIKDLEEKSDQFIDSIPIGIRDAFFDNDYINNIRIINDFLIEELFNTLYEDVFWFINDWEPGYDIKVNDENYIINNDDDFFNYIKKVYYNE